MRDAIIIGAGVNGLVTAAFLAKAGLKPLVLERAERVGGCAITSEIAPGFQCPTLAHTAAIDPAIVRALALERHGLQIIRPQAHACAPTRDRRALVLWTDARRAAANIGTFSTRDAEQYPRFLDSFARIAAVLRAMNATPPPSIDNPTPRDVIELLKTGRRFRSLGKADAYRLLRWMPMAVADLVAEWFESEPLRATIAVGGILGSFLGPWSAGTSALLLLLGAGEGHPVGTGWLARGGTGAVADALASAARHAGAELRTGVDVQAIAVDEGSATGVVLATGETIAARAVISSADPQRTLLHLVDPVHLTPDFLRRIRNIRMHGTLAKVNYAVSSLPRFDGLHDVDATEQTAALSGRIRLNRDIDGVERAFDAAKYGGYAEEPSIELTIPSIGDDSLAPAGRHVVSAYVQFAPYRLRGTTWEAERERLSDATTRTIATYAPGFESTIVARQVITPLDLERTYGLTGGHIFHGELALDQFFVTRPLLGWARYGTPIRRLFVCGSGTHPGTGLNGRSGAMAAKEILKATRNLILCVLGVLCVFNVLVVSQARQIYGFTPRSSADERAIERRFLALPSPDRAREAHAFLTADPHVAGSPRDRGLAEWVRDRWREYGLEQVAITQHDVLLPYATDVSVEMTLRPAQGEPARPWRASLKEDPVAGDPFSARDVGLPYHAYSASGDVTAPVVYAGGGNPADYDWLAEHGIDVKGKIVLVRYSVPYSYRGFKALTAQQRGVAGLLIYSDPADDGFKKGKTYPDGPWGPDSHIQRGGIVYDFLVPGDPLTPGWPSLPGARRIAARDAVSLPKIMSVPLSWKDARPILEALKGPDAPAAWQGGLPFTYRVGRGQELPVVRMRVKMDDAVRPIWTVTARITGTTYPNQLVIAGNHRDAWVYGGVDPSSGSASLMELARSLGALAKQGARPKRTIVLASWDAEEFTLTSSTEWGEEHEHDLTAHAVAYLNVDSSVSGRSFGASAVPALNRLVTEVAETVLDPNTGRSIAAVTEHAGPRAASALPGASGAELVNNRLGSGSDYTVFLNFIGVPVVDMSFTGPYGVYHSAYDNHVWMAKFGDPGFRYHAAMTRLWGLMILRLANADIVPLDYTPYASRIREFVDELAAHARPADRDALAPARLAAGRLAAAADRMARAVDRALRTDAGDRARAPAITSALIATERALTDHDGIPGRPWYRHLIYAPKPTYAPEVLPGLAEAIDAGDRERLADQVKRLAAALDHAAAILNMEPRITK